MVGFSVSILNTFLTYDVAYFHFIRTHISNVVAFIRLYSCADPNISGISLISALPLRELLLITYTTLPLTSSRLISLQAAISLLSRASTTSSQCLTDLF